MFAIICKARKGADVGVEHLAMADRRHSGGRFWTSDNPHIIRVFPSKVGAEIVAGKLKHNYPQVVELATARRVVMAQARHIKELERERMHEDALDDPSWDAHKDWT